MFQEQRDLVEKILNVYRKHDDISGFFDCYIDEQEIYDEFWKMFKNPKSILREYKEQYDELYEKYSIGELSKEKIQEALNVMREIKKYIWEFDREIL